LLTIFYWGDQMEDEMDDGEKKNARIIFVEKRERKR
jgi:hypothetical protein